MLALPMLLASTTTPPPSSTPIPWNFGVFGIGAIVFVILSTWLFFERRERLASRVQYDEAMAEKDANFQARLEEKDAEIAALQLARLQDAQAMAERTLPLLGDTAKVLDASLAQARSAASQRDIASTIERMEGLVERMERRQEPPR